MEKNTQPQCYSCLHYTQQGGCGPCASQNLDRVKKVLSSVTPNGDPVKQELDLLKYACKVVIQDPSDFNVVNPWNCKYYMPNVFKIRTA